MYAIVEIAGQQFKVAKDQKVFVNRLSTEEGKTVDFDNVLLIGDGDNTTLGAPAIDGALVGAKVLRHLKGDKVIVFKKKRRKGYRVKNGHRQSLTEIVIESIVSSGAKPSKKADPKKETKKVEARAAAPKAKKATGKADDLKKIEGVGPKAAEALVEAGLDTFAKVAKAKPEAIEAILAEANSRLAHLVANTWPQQAQLAADGKWDELKELQDNLDGGRK
ncbi:50S ribosomal protein L21 [Winogradskyella bathintestinalis]|uniref:Large ribosomal subunit protein bL21 n=1 Tax=Winogradskyella bathintestinalis TaxID=3035208 RepID=A0ABT7ZQX4_9FLAO|nr:50S ribosomal protein L21 [Winogradskyella bathintestinalis]MDN3491403.1 50S ribosomal protein L21 [Winogradskyella bathintestinalis]